MSDLVERAKRELVYLKETPETTRLDILAALIGELVGALEAKERECDGAYSERSHLVAALARLFPSGYKKTQIEGWDPAWHNCVYIDLPTGQVSYHYHDVEAHLFDELPSYRREWDGHDKAIVHDRLRGIERDTVQRQLREVAERAWKAGYTNEGYTVGESIAEAVDRILAEVSATSEKEKT